MIRVELEISAPDMTTLDVAAWAAVTLNEELPTFSTVHRIYVEEVDA